MKDAAPRTHAGTIRRTTRYEVVAVGGAGTVTVSFTSRLSRQGLLTELQARGQELIDFWALTDTEEVAPVRDEAGRWWMVVQAPGAPKVDPLTVARRAGFSGRTESDVRAGGGMRGSMARHVTSTRRAGLVGRPVRFDVGWGYVDGVVTADLGAGMVECAARAEYAGRKGLTYIYPYDDVRTDAEVGAGPA